MPICHHPLCAAGCPGRRHQTSPGRRLPTFRSPSSLGQLQDTTAVDGQTKRRRQRRRRVAFNSYVYFLLPQKPCERVVTLMKEGHNTSRGQQSEIGTFDSKRPCAWSNKTATSKYTSKYTSGFGKAGGGSIDGPFLGAGGFMPRHCQISLFDTSIFIPSAGLQLA